MKYPFVLILITVLSTSVKAEKLIRPQIQNFCEGMNPSTLFFL